jgi:hypothetical protein
LINDTSGLDQSIEINSTLTQLDRFAQGPKMINKMRADVLAVEQP